MHNFQYVIIRISPSVCVLPAERPILLRASNSALQFLKSFFSFGFSVFLVLRNGMNTFMYFLFRGCHTHTTKHINKAAVHTSGTNNGRRDLENKSRVWINLSVSRRSVPRWSGSRSLQWSTAAVCRDAPASADPNQKSSWNPTEFNYTALYTKQTALQS